MLLQDYEKLEIKTTGTNLHSYTELESTDSSLDIPRVHIYLKDPLEWQKGWNMTIPKDLSKIKILYYWAAGYFDNIDDNIAPGYIGRISFNQNGKQISNLVGPGLTDYLIENGKHTEALYPETQLDFNKVTKFFRVLLYENDKVPGKKGQYFLFPPLYLTHK